MKENAPNSHPKIITDLGQSVTAKMITPAQNDKTNAEARHEEHEAGEITIPRYGVWQWDQYSSRYRTIDTGDDLEALKKKHGIKEEPLPIPTP